MTTPNASCSFAGIALPVWNQSAARWVGRQVPLAEYAPLDDPHTYGYDLAHLHLRTPFPQPDTEVGTLRWPQGASRWAVGHFVVTEAKLDEIRAAVGVSNSAQPLVMSDAVTGGTLTASMFLLPPRPLLVGQPETDDGPLWVMTLTDERFFWWRKPLTLDPVPASWDDLFAAIETALGIGAITGRDQVPAAYDVPTDRFRVFNVPAPLVLDAAAEAVGMRFIRGLDGTYQLQSWAAARAASEGFYATHTAAAAGGRGRVLGGGLLASGDIARHAPGRLRVVFGRKVGGTVTGGGYAVTRTLSGYTHAPADDLTLSAYYGLNASGMLGYEGLFTADAYAEYTGSALTNEATLSALARQAGHDWYGWRLGDVDVNLAGVIPWGKDAFADQVKWTYDEDRVETRVQRKPYFDANVYGSHRPPAAAAGGDGFWAALVSKTGSTCPAYQFRRVSKTSAGCGWAVDDAEADPEGTAYDVNAVDHPVNDPVTGAAGVFHVFKLYPGAGAWFVIDQPPRWEFVRTTGTEPDETTGFYPGVLLHFPHDADPGDAEAVWIWDLNATP